MSDTMISAVVEGEHIYGVAASDHQSVEQAQLCTVPAPPLRLI